MPQGQMGLFDTQPDRQQIRFSLAIVGLLFAAFLLILPVRNDRLGEVVAFIPAIDAVMLFGELIIATLLYAQASIFRSQALTVLASGYVFATLLLIPHALTFPGAFAPNGLLGAGVNTTAWITITRRVAFPIAIIVFVARKREELTGSTGTTRPLPRIGVGVLASAALAAVVAVLATSGRDLLPMYFINRSDLAYANAVKIEAMVFALHLAAIVVLFRQRSSVLDMWLLVALSAWLIQSLLIMTLHGRFTAGWYYLYVLMLFSLLVVMIALIAESIRLYAQLALANAARIRDRDARLISMEALAAAISHEVGQPLTSVTLNATAALTSLTRDQPDSEMAIKSMHATIDAGHRTFEVVRNIRAMFAKEPEAATEFSLNDLVRETASLLGRELASNKVSLRLALDEALPPVKANRVHLQQVLINLFTNAIEALRATPGRSRHIVIRSAVNDRGVLLDCSDTGSGIDPDAIEEIFEPFFTTKPTGTGLGLALCRTFVEGCGGRLWASQDEGHGATFHLQLPSSQSSVP